MGKYDRGADVQHLVPGIALVVVTLIAVGGMLMLRSRADEDRSFVTTQLRTATIGGTVGCLAYFVLVYFCVD